MQYNHNNVQNYIALYILSHFSNFIANDGGTGGAVSAANMPLAFRGSNMFKANRGRSFVVSHVLGNLLGSFW